MKCWATRRRSRQEPSRWPRSRHRLWDDTVDEPVNAGSMRMRETRLRRTRETGEEYQVPPILLHERVRATEWPPRHASLRNLRKKANDERMNGNVGARLEDLPSRHFLPDPIVVPGLIFPPQTPRPVVSSQTQPGDRLLQPLCEAHPQTRFECCSTPFSGSRVLRRGTMVWFPVRGR